MLDENKTTVTGASIQQRVSNRFQQRRALKKQITEIVQGCGLQQRRHKGQTKAARSPWPSLSTVTLTCYNLWMIAILGLNRPGLTRYYPKGR